MISGFALFRGNTVYILESSGKNVTDKVAHKFIDAICDVREQSGDTRNALKSSKEFVDYTKSCIGRCTVEKVDTGKVVYYHIEGDNYTQNIPLAESDCIVFIDREGQLC